MAKRHSPINSTPVAVTPYAAVVAERNLTRMEWDCQLFAIRSYNVLDRREHVPRDWIEGRCPIFTLTAA
jgi:hypothetical protein